MTLRQLRRKLREIRDNPSDVEVNHVDADEVLLDFINDKIVREIWVDIERWYA